MSQSSKNRKSSLWQNGIVLSFDLDTTKLKEYYSKTSPQGAYDLLKRFLIKNGFEHRKDSDYVNPNIERRYAVRLLHHFMNDNKWFPLCINKMNISPNVEVLDIAEDLRELAEENWTISHEDKFRESEMIYQ